MVPQTIFSLFDNYGWAREAVANVMAQAKLEAGEVNAIVRESTVKDALDYAQLNKVGVKKTDEVGHQQLSGLDRVVAGQQPLTTADAGDIVAGGDIATVIGKTAANENDTGRSLERSLTAFGIPDEQAREFAGGVLNGGVMVIVHAEESKAHAAAEAMRNHKGKLVGRYQRG